MSALTMVMHRMPSIPPSQTSPLVLRRISHLCCTNFVIVFQGVDTCYCLAIFVHATVFLDSSVKGQKCRITLILKSSDVHPSCSAGSIWVPRLCLFVRKCCCADADLAEALLPLALVCTHGGNSSRCASHILAYTRHWVYLRRNAFRYTGGNANRRNSSDDLDDVDDIHSIVYDDDHDTHSVSESL